MDSVFPSSLTGMKKYQPRRLWWRRWASRAAVTAIVSNPPEMEDLSILLMKRATRLGDPWSGHMSFPGGRSEPTDKNIFETAKRELREETGCDIDQTGHLIGRLTEVIARPLRWQKRPFVITPFVFFLQQQPQWDLQESEVETLVWVPVRFLADRSNRSQMIWDRRGIQIPLPCYNYQGYRIWGLTLRMIDELVPLIHVDA